MIVNFCINDLKHTENINFLENLSEINLELDYLLI